MWFLPDPVLLAPATRAFMGKKMEMYAGMVENLDHHVGRLVDHLKQIGEYDNTVFIVFGDNGAEGTDLFKMIAGTPGTRDYLFAAMRWSQTHPNAWGDPGSYVAYGPMWAQASMTPFSQYKGWLAEGGIRNALIVSGPVVQRPKGSINHGLMHVGGHHADAALDCRHELSKSRRRRARTAPADRQVLGTKCWPAGGIAADGPATISPGSCSATARCDRASGRSAGSSSRWARVRGSSSTSGRDPAERHDLAAAQPDKVKELTALWDSYVAANNVVLPSRSVFETLDDQLPQRTPVDAGYPPLVNKRQFVPPKDMLAEPKP